MNRLELLLLDEAALTSSPLPASLAVDPEIVVDGQRVGDGLYLDWRELFRTLRFSGEFFLFTSASGEPLDAGVEDGVEVTRSADTVRWDWGSPISWRRDADGTERPVRTWLSAEFERATYDDTVRRGWWRACSLIRRDPTCLKLPQSLRAADLQDLARWIQTDAARPIEAEMVGTPAERTFGRAG